MKNKKMYTDELKVLIVEDDQDYAYLIERLIKHGMPNTNVLADLAYSYDEAIAAFRCDVFNICILDYRLGADNGLKLLSSLREDGIVVPIIFLSGESDTDMAAQTIKSGAYDFLSKERLNANSLCRSIRSALKQQAEMDQLIEEHMLSF